MQESTFITREGSTEKFDVREWPSLSRTEKECLQSSLEGFFNASVSDVVNACSKPTKGCEEYCKNARLFNRHIDNVQIQKLLNYSSHPATLDQGYTWMVPFCGQGVDNIEQFRPDALRGAGLNTTAKVRAENLYLSFYVRKS